jgi:hypothetical protein
MKSLSHLEVGFGRSAIIQLAPCSRRGSANDPVRPSLWNNPESYSQIRKSFQTWRNLSRGPIHARAHTELCTERAVKIGSVAEAAAKGDVQCFCGLSPQTECRAPQSHAEKILMGVIPASASNV